MTEFSVESFPVEPENGVVSLYSEVFLYPFICFDGQDILITTLHLDLVMLSQNLKQGLILK